MTVMESETYAVVLEAFIRKNFLVRPDDAYFDGNVNLWEEGYVDSMGVIEVIAFLEETFNVTIPDEMLFSPDFTSISGMSKLIAELKST